MKRATGLLSILLIFLSTNCSIKPTDYVEIVRGGTMNEYPSTTIGQAFDASFDNPKWEAIITQKGQKLVQFTGTVSEGTHRMASMILFERYGHKPTKKDWQETEKYWATGSPVRFQWLISVDDRSFQLADARSEAWMDSGINEVFEVIYK